MPPASAEASTPAADDGGNSFEGRFDAHGLAS